MIQAIPIEEEKVVEAVKKTITVAGRVLPKPEYSVPGLLIATAIIASKLLRGTLGNIFLAKAVYDVYVKLEKIGEKKA